MIGASGELVVSINLPSGYHFTKGANSRYEVVVEPQPPQTPSLWKACEAR